MAAGSGPRTPVRAAYRETTAALHKHATRLSLDGPHPLDELIDSVSAYEALRRRVGGYRDDATRLERVRETLVAAVALHLADAEELDGVACRRLTETLAVLERR